jgi:hypothetical protein
MTVGPRVCPARRRRCLPWATRRLVSDGAAASVARPVARPIYSRRSTNRSGRILEAQPLDEAILGLTAQIAVAHVDNDPLPGVRAGSGLFNGMEAELLPVNTAPFKTVADGWASLVSVLIRVGLPVVGPGR